ncbi:MSMEG_0570 family nitrogen starvation response protein [Azohydromonas lata]|uniref:MSMEG_0570 family nitrogen starvation response protein n=1 Tax=Azohydromonas lata TaxID=45677 RepID=A0ABU5IHT2_9BURK|nr:MSMEG_0570 family nitrogen starvation response protein [Azohydromonas lata]MDZ5458498.1 MSMEG_0570 family nitrogen starvation response protein [Azohydromonas lata]
MPAMHYTLRWPDASETVCYSPSLVIQDYFQPGQAYALESFMAQLREATAIANERVRAKFGFACSRADDQLSRLEAQARRWAGQPGARVEVLGFGPAH